MQVHLHFVYLATLVLLISAVCVSGRHHSKHNGDLTVHHKRHTSSCNLRVVREIARRVCSFHTEEYLAMSGEVNNEVDVQLQYYQKILHTCCPDGCPGIVKMCS